ncbi:MAG: CRISPR-associated protein Cas4, partial [Bacteroidetes bacterium]|nr:CRISPR-associated protein Cas4 [Bacteroidota bacterium]
MRITGTHFAYFQICHRKLWLFSNGITMEQHSELVDEGRLIHETSYQQRPNRYEELEIDGIKIDYYDPAKKCIHE